MRQERGIPAEEFVGTVPPDYHTDLLSRQSADQRCRDDGSVGEGLVEKPKNLRHDVQGPSVVQNFEMMIGPELFGDRVGEERFIEGFFMETDREGLDF